MTTSIKTLYLHGLQYGNTTICHLLCNKYDTITLLLLFWQVYQKWHTLTHQVDDTHNKIPVVQCNNNKNNNEYENPENLINQNTKRTQPQQEIKKREFYALNKNKSN